MPWIQISANGEELDRRDLSAAVVIGRSPECDIVVRDILLSRSHCRIEPVGEGWKVIDLNSKNGTRVGWQDMRLHVLRDGDHLRMGRTRIAYHTGPFEPAAERIVRTSRLVRPADPHEALTGTVTDFVLVDDEESGRDDEVESYTDHPFPQPRPLDPVTDAEPVAQSSFDDVASSFWCREGDATSAIATEVLASPRITMRALPRLKVKPVYREIRRSVATDTDLSLQADARQVAPEAVVAVPQLSWRQRHLATAGLVLAAGLGSGIVIMSIWLLTFAP